MIEIDGAEKSGSGTIVRYAVALSSLLGETLHLKNIRAKRDKPGLRPQHLASVNACAKLCQAQVAGAAVDSRELTYKPGHIADGGYYEWNIGTAGSTTLFITPLLPIALFAGRKAIFKVSGGLFQDFAPSAHHMQHVLLPTLRKMGVQIDLEVVRPGYVPRGGGIIQVAVSPARNGIRPLTMLGTGKVKEIRGIALASHLKEAKVSQRMAETCRKILTERGYNVNIETIDDNTALQPGASLAVWAETETGCIIGADQAGARGRSSESIGRYVGRNLLDDLETGATVDRFLADQLIIYAALADGTTEYVIPRMTEHVEANLWLVEKFGARTVVEGNTVRIKGTGHRKQTGY